MRSDSWIWEIFCGMPSNIFVGWTRFSAGETCIERQMTIEPSRKSKVSSKGMEVSGRKWSFPKGRFRLAVERDA